jgi:hypothetical protein
MRTLLKIALLLPLVLFGAFFVLRVWMSATEPRTPEEIRRFTHARTLAEAVCGVDLYSEPDPAMVTGMIDQGGDVNQWVPARTYGGPPRPLLLHTATCSGKHTQPIVELLIARGARVDNVDLGEVAQRRDMLELLLAHGARLDTPWHPDDPKLGTQLIQAAVPAHQTWLVDRLLAAGADPQIVNGYGAGLVVLALNGGGGGDDDYIATLQRLLAAKAHIDPLNANEAAALVVAARDGRMKTLKLLLDAGAAVDASMVSKLLYPRHFGMERGRASALTAAAYDCHVDAVQLLLQAGAHVPALGVHGDPFDQRTDICWEALGRATDRPKQEQIRTLLGLSAPGAAR